MTKEASITAPASVTLSAPTAERGTDGRWVKGTSGNPSGRPPSKAVAIRDLQQTLEEFVRSKVRSDRIVKIVDKLCSEAEKGNVKAAKVLLEYTMTKPQLPEEGSGEAKGGITIRIENATFKAQKTPDNNVIEGEYNES